MSFKIDTFTSKLTDGGALGSLFECELSLAKGTMGDVGDFKFMCKGAVLPGSTIEPGTVTYMGRALQIPGNRAAGTLSTEVYNDETMEIRNHIENWMELLNSHKSNRRAPNMTGIGSYTGSLKVHQLSKADIGPVKSYEFIDAWPSACAEIPLSWETNEIQTFAVTWEYNYWKSTESGTGTT